MKIRIKGNSIRFRLSKPEVASLVNTGYLEEQTLFAVNKFVYALRASGDESELSATFEEGKMTVLIPKMMIVDWPENTTVGFSSHQQLTATNSLHLLVEKDFTCLDETTEDQSDHYDNPNKTC